MRKVTDEGREGAALAPIMNGAHRSAEREALSLSLSLPWLFSSFLDACPGGSNYEHRSNYSLAAAAAAARSDGASERASVGAVIKVDLWHSSQNEWTSAGRLKVIKTQNVQKENSCILHRLFQVSKRIKLSNKLSPFMPNNSETNLTS